MGNTFFFLVDFIIAQNLEKVKFWNLLSGAKRSLRTEGAEEEGSREEGMEQGEKGKRETEQNRKIGYVGNEGGVAVWRFQFLPFARKAAPVFACQYMAIKKVIRKAIFFKKRLDSLRARCYNLTVARNKTTDTNRGEGLKLKPARQLRALKLDNGIWYHNDKKGRWKIMESTKSYLLTMKQWENEARERAVAGISKKLVEAGIIQQGQKEIAPAKIRAAFKAAYMPELLAQETKSSTGGAGKFADVATRCLMREARELAMPIYDLRCRPCSIADLYIYTDRMDEKTAKLFPSMRVMEEVKTGAGCLAQAGEIAESWGALIAAIEGNKTIVWYPFSIPGWQSGDIEVMDDAPYFFGTYGQLFDLLESYNGSIDTWLKVCGTAVNFQNVTSSGKKMAFLESVCENGWDWPLFRDWGRIREK